MSEGMGGRGVGGGAGGDLGGGMVSLIKKIYTITMAVRGEHGFVKLIK